MGEERLDGGDGVETLEGEVWVREVVGARYGRWCRVVGCVVGWGEGEDGYADGLGV